MLDFHGCYLLDWLLGLSRWRAEETFLESLLHANIPPEVVDVAWLTTLDRLWIGVELSMILSLGLVVVNLPVAC